MLGRQLSYNLPLNTPGTIATNLCEWMVLFKPFSRGLGYFQIVHHLYSLIAQLGSYLQCKRWVQETLQDRTKIQKIYEI